MSARDRRLRSWLLLTAFAAAVGMLWTESEARACSGPAPVARKAGSCCGPKTPAACCCQGPAERPPAPASPGRNASACETAAVAGASSCVCEGESAPAERSSRPSASTPDSRSSVADAGPAAPEPDASPRSSAFLRTTPFDPLGSTVLLRTSRLRF